MTYVVMEYVPGKNLEMFLRNVAYLTEDEARPIFQQVVTAVHFLHQRLIAHRDIKLENILIDRAGNVKLCDFGLAIQLKEGQMLKESCGSLHYMAPEILAGKPYDGLAVDMWSLGVVLYVLVTGQFPYEERTYHGMHKVISKTKYPLPYHLSKPCCQTIGRLLAVPTRHRITISQLQERRWLGHIKDHVEPAKKEILLRVIDILCTSGYSCEEIVSTLTHRQPNTKLAATVNILKHKLISGECHQENGNSCLNNSCVGALQPLFPLKRTASVPSIHKIIQAGNYNFEEEGEEGKAKRFQSENMLDKLSCLEMLPSSEERLKKGNDWMANVIHSATRYFAMHMKCVDSQPCDGTTCESGLHATPTTILSTISSSQQPPLRTNMSNDQAQVPPTISGSRAFRAWKLIKKRLSHALRELCCLPEPFPGESWTLL
ncbi:putative sperm motility kinase W [Phodopus roborovskii]|nr:putative sperm motility kinase W [Phodopus roborovskii]